ncbi:MAG: DNA polymerase IV [Campylobacterota bacterium]|nr:DNA polymerase IV [Campylobacterota bacterium]
MFLHIDIDSFFASAERSIDPSLKNIPMAVGGRSNLEIFNPKRTNIRLMDENSGAFVTPVFYSDKEKTFRSFFIDKIDGREKIRGIITTSSYEARTFGVKTGMPIAHALKLCPHLVVVPSHYLLYHTLSRDIHRFLQSQIPNLEQYSIDEFFGDVQGWIEEDNIYSFSLELQNAIYQHFDIPVSIGISKAKWIAKLATGYAKPFNIYHVRDINAFIEEIPIKEFPGIGRGFQRRLEEHYIYTLGQARRRKSLFYSWKKPGIQLYHRITGSDNEGICSRPERKSIGISRTFDRIVDSREIKRRMMIMARHIIYLVMKKEVNPTFFYLKINYEYGIRAKITYNSHRLFSEKLFKESLSQMYANICKEGAGAIKITLSVSRFSTQEKRTLSLLSLDEDRKEYQLSSQLQKLRERFGLDIIRTGNEL